MFKTLKQYMLMALSLLLLAEPLQAAEWKRFSDIETGLVFITGDVSVEEINTLSATQVRSGGQNLALLKAPMTALQEVVAPIVTERGAEVLQSLKSYTLDDQPRYQQLESVLPLARKTNEVLMKTYFINSAIETQNQLLPGLDKQLQAGNISAADKAALALVTLSLGHFVSKASVYGQTLPDDITGLSAEVASKVSQLEKAIRANPMNALQMGPELQLLLEAQTALRKAGEMSAHSTQLLPAQTQKLVQLMQRVHTLF